MKKIIRIAALVATLSCVALAVTAPAVSAAESQNPVEVMIEDGDPFEAITAQATIGTAIGAALINLFYNLLLPFAVLIDTITGTGLPLTAALGNAAVAACRAIGGFPFSFGGGDFQGCEAR
jgi:ABC-type oligopeptide transport system substrate-binding subunit